MLCPKCGFEIPETTNRCSGCGLRIHRSRQRTVSFGGAPATDESGEWRSSGGWGARVTAWLSRFAERLGLIRTVSIERIVPRTGEQAAHPPLDEMPPEVRDWLDGRPTADKTTVERHVYDSIDEVPAEIRERMDRVRSTGGVRIELVDETTGEMHTFRSLEEIPARMRDMIPPDVRARLAEVQRGSPSGD